MQLQKLTTAERVAALAALLVAIVGIASFLSRPAEYLRLVEAVGVGMVGVSALFGGLAPVLNRQHAKYSKYRAAAFVFGGLLFCFAFGLQCIRGF